MQLMGMLRQDKAAVLANKLDAMQQLLLLHSRCCMASTSFARTAAWSCGNIPKLCMCFSLLLLLSSMSCLERNLALQQVRCQERP
jgi:hypothetical protein